MKPMEVADTPPALMLASLRSQGAQGFDPVRFHYLETLYARMQTQHGALRQALEDKLQAALRDYAELYGQAPKTLAADVVRRQAAKPSPLAGLNRYLESASQHGMDDGLDVGAPRSGELKSVREFKRTVAKQQAQDQVLRAVEMGPENAGPLNSHMLVLRSLSLMRELSPDYLQRFLSHAGALLWLDACKLRPAPQDAKPTRRGRPKA